MAQVGISLGSNLGDKTANLQQAKNYLLELMPVKATHLQAPLYQSAPVDCPELSPDFYNTAIEIIFEGRPEQLLNHTQQIESTIGREDKVVLNEPRKIDIDIIYFDDLIIDTPELSLPHPRAHQRKFVLEPFTEICPDRILPNHTLTISELLEQLSSEESPLTHLQSHW